MTKLDEVCMANQLYIKRKLYLYTHVKDRSIAEQIEDFSKSIDDLEVLDVEIRDEAVMKTR